MPSQPWNGPGIPVHSLSLEVLILEAEAAAHSAFRACHAQTGRVRLARQLAKDGDTARALEAFRNAEQKAAGVVEEVLDALICLQRLRAAVLQGLASQWRRLPAAGRDVLDAAAAVALWSDAEPAAALLGPCRVISGNPEVADQAFPEPAALEETGPAVFDVPEMRAGARSHGVSLPFLEFAGGLMRPPGITKAA